jgi:hypothetical protein
MDNDTINNNGSSYITVQALFLSFLKFKKMCKLCKTNFYVISQNTFLVNAFCSMFNDAKQSLCHIL